MVFQKRLTTLGLALIVLAGVPRLSMGGLITFTGDAALVSALGGSLSTGVKQVAIGQTFDLGFKATVAGVESVSGNVLFSNTASGGTVQLSNVIFTLLSPSTTSVGFGLSVNQAFTSTGPNTLELQRTGSGFAHLTSPSTQFQPGDVGVTAGVSFTPAIKPDPNTTVSSIPTGRSLFNFGGDPYPEDLAYSLTPQHITGITKTTISPVSLIFDYSTTLTAFNSYTGAGSATTLDAASLSYSIAPAAVPEPASLALLGIGAMGIALIARRHRSA